MNTHPHSYTRAARLGRWLGAALVALALAGCATGPNRNPKDPLEPFNRTVFRFNDALDTAVLKPVAQTYNDVTPRPVRTGVRNFFGNLGDAWSAVNNLLQLKPVAAAETGMRFGVNTVFGVLGLVDVASDIGLERHKEDFGRTLGRYGVPSGPYVMLPILGPSTVRDTLALPVETQGNLLSGVDPVKARNQLYVLRIVDARANLLRVSSVLEDAALDKYTFTRDAYLQFRQNEVEQSRGRGETPDTLTLPFNLRR